MRKPPLFASCLSSLGQPPFQPTEQVDIGIAPLGGTNDLAPSSFFAPAFYGVVHGTYQMVTTSGLKR